jgi:hypothetical protein
MSQLGNLNLLEVHRAQPVPKAYRKCCVKFRTTPTLRSGLILVKSHSEVRSAGGWWVAKGAGLNLKQHRRTSLRLAVCPALAEPECSTRKIIIDNKKKFARPCDLVGSSCLISAFLRSAFLRSEVQLASYAFLPRLDKLDHVSGEIETV